MVEKIRVIAKWLASLCLALVAVSLIYSATRSEGGFFKFPTALPANSATSVAKSVYLPHVAPNIYPWTTSLVLDNAGLTDVTATLTLYESGMVKQSQKIIATAGKTTKLDLDRGVCGKLEYSGSDVIIKEVFIAGSESGMAEFVLDSETSSELNYLLPQYSANELDWIGVAAMNPGDAPAAVTFTAFDDKGVAVSIRQITVEGFNRKALLADELFPGIDWRALARIHASSDKSLCGIVISGRGTGKLLFTKAQKESNETVYLPHIALRDTGWETKIILDNFGNSDVQARIRLYSSGTNTVDRTIVVSAGSTQNLLVDDMTLSADSGQIDYCSLGGARNE